MKFLAFDSSTEQLSVAVGVGELVYFNQEMAGQNHSLRLMPMINQTLVEAGLDLQDMDGICFGSGPGSFTGLRIACGMAQGLALGMGLKVAPVSTLLALAELAGVQKVVAAIDARMGEIYLGAYERINGIWKVGLGPGVYAPQSVPALSGNGWVAIGNGFDHYPEVTEMYGPQLISIRAGEYPHAREVLLLGREQFMRNEQVDAADAAPVYIRNKVALKMSERSKR
ncbi:MAG: tRNA (adenosine(37)-N6)-threonylcarbamoyltransferase complex dimerization subunit type 1 TsaB [Proteobacteria bacterium]|nr:tRNA (adenosine(37)-N6)-threonylcarbamoyltransferase complex dimerization subunit type 1 TsaB [Pseudomonadota bacterium]MDE3208900.1 tRNA (adenosine(37)-N6)-threonylcarbamoyltransferase complex dimerization subunit type 1 TsaB [Pseudomonadota bacterium]